MMSTRTSKGIKIGDRGNKALSTDVVKLLKTQDAGYLRTMLQQTRKERERLEEVVKMSEQKDRADVKVVNNARKPKGTHTVFVSDVKEQKEFDPERWFGTNKSGLARTYNRPLKTSDVDGEEKKESLREGDLREKIKILREQRRPQREVDAVVRILKQKRNERKKRSRQPRAQLSRVEAVKKREKELSIAQEELETQRARMSNNIGGVTKKGLNFRIRERKR